VGFSYAKIAALKDLAAKTLSGVVPTAAEFPLLDDEQIIERLVSVRGIGRWSAQMLLMFHLGREDVLPADDFGVRNGFRLAYGLKGLPHTKALLAWGERWKPHRSAASWYLWRAVDLHREAKLPKAGRAPRIAIVVARSKKSDKAKQKVKAKKQAGTRVAAKK
jgi:DNA-3-methyladenine glycosylase II